MKKVLKQLSELPNLQTLVLDSKIDDACLQVLSKFPALTSLSLEECEKVTDVGLKDISSSSTLQDLKMTGLGIKVTKAGSEGLIKLRSLNLVYG